MFIDLIKPLTFDLSFWRYKRLDLKQNHLYLSAQKSIKTGSPIKILHIRSLVNLQKLKFIQESTYSVESKRPRASHLIMKILSTTILFVLALCEVSFQSYDGIAQQQRQSSVPVCRQVLAQ